MAGRVYLSIILHLRAGWTRYSLELPGFPGGHYEFIAQGAHCFARAASSDDSEL
jgi:hypothetical protein